MFKKLILTAALLMVTAVAAHAAPTKIDAKIAKYKAVSGVAGNLGSIGSDTLNNLMTYWAEGFKKKYPNVNIQVEGKGSSTAPPALIAGTAQLGPMSREMKSTEIEQFEKSMATNRPRSVWRSIRWRFTSTRTTRSRACRLMRWMPFFKNPQAWRRRDHHLGTIGRNRQIGQHADQSLRSQLRFRHIWLFQGAYPEGRRL